MANLSGRVAVVTGAGRGIGAATARKLAADGAHVAVVDLNEDLCQETVGAIKSAGGEAMAVGCDVSDAEQVERAFERIAGEWGRVDILVNNAGVTRDNLGRQEPRGARLRAGVACAPPRCDRQRR